MQIVKPYQLLQLDFHFAQDVVTCSRFEAKYSNGNTLAYTWNCMAQVYKLPQ